MENLKKSACFEIHKIKKLKSRQTTYDRFHDEGNWIVKY